MAISGTNCSPLVAIKYSSTQKVVKNGVIEIEIRSQIGRWVVVIKNIPQYGCSTIDEKPAQLVSICLLWRAGQG